MYWLEMAARHGVADPTIVTLFRGNSSEQISDLIEATAAHFQNHGDAGLQQLMTMAAAETVQDDELGHAS